VKIATVCYGCARFWRRFALFAAWPMTLWFSLPSVPVAAQEPQPKRPATVEDAIRMVRIAGHLSNLSYEGALTENFAYFSPDRRQFVVILKKGNLETNTNDYSLVLFRTD